MEFLEKYCKHDDQAAVVAMLTSSDQMKDKEAAMSYSCVKEYFMKMLDGADLEVVRSL